MRRSPRVNQEVLLRATFLGWSAGLFFARGRVMNGVPLACGHRHVEGQGHDEDQAVEAVGVAELSILNAEAARFEVREHRLDAPAISILKSAQVAGFFGHAMIQGSAWPGSWMMPMWVRARRPVSSTFS